MVADPATGQVLLSDHGAQLATPASTTKLATALASLRVLGAGARFTTRVVDGAAPASIILVGGGDPTLAVNPFPVRDYPPARHSSASLAAATDPDAEGGAAAKTRSALGYDTSLYTGPGPGGRAGRAGTSAGETSRRSSRWRWTRAG